MILTYKSPPMPGTIVGYDKTREDVTERFIAVDYNGNATWDGTGYVPNTLRLASAMESYDIAKAGNGFEPRSIVEFYMLRRTWTVYGYAKVWGTTTAVQPPKPVQKPTPYKRPSALDMKHLVAEQQRKREKCADWYLEWRGITKPAPRDQSYIKLVNEMYRNMRLAGGAKQPINLPKTTETLKAMRGE